MVYVSNFNKFVAGIGASQKEKYLSRLLYRICGSGDKNGFHEKARILQRIPIDFTLGGYSDRSLIAQGVPNAYSWDCFEQQNQLLQLCGT